MRTTQGPHEDRISSVPAALGAEPMDEFSEAGTWYWRATAGPPRAHGAAQVRRGWRASCARRGSGEAQLAGLVLEVHGPEKARDGASSASGGKGGGGTPRSRRTAAERRRLRAEEGGGEDSEESQARRLQARQPVGPTSSALYSTLQHRRCKVNIGRHLPPCRCR